MSARTCKAEPVNWQASLRSCMTKQDVKRSPVSPSSSIKTSRSSLVSQKTLLQPVKGQASVTSSKSKQDVKPSLVSPSSSIEASRSPLMSQKTSLQPGKGKTSPTSNKTKQDVKPSLVSPSSSIRASRSPLVSQTTSRRVASSAKDIKDSHKEITKNSSLSKGTGNFILTVELRKTIITFRGIIDLPLLTGHLSITNSRGVRLAAASSTSGFDRTGHQGIYMRTCSGVRDRRPLPGHDPPSGVRPRR
ncbi:hypothetical protein YC2023_057252 [Brassica napus]